MYHSLGTNLYILKKNFFFHFFCISYDFLKNEFYEKIKLQFERLHSQILLNNYRF